MEYKDFETNNQYDLRRIRGECRHHTSMGRSCEVLITGDLCSRMLPILDLCKRQGLSDQDIAESEVCDSILWHHMEPWIIMFYRADQVLPYMP